MIEEWKKYEFSNCLVDNNVGRSNQINASEIKPTGKYPVIDQGQDFIAGYTDEEEKLVSEGFPYIIFGDHTRCFKYVDFPFVVGADGTKVLSPNKELFDPKFFYFHLLSFDIPSRGYNRHYKLLKEKIILRPELPEQRKIAYILSTVQKAIEQQDKLIRTTTELKKALMQKLFTEGTKGEKQKQTEIGLVPEDWEVKTFAELFEIIKSQSHSRNKLTYEATNSQVYNIHYGDIHSTFTKPVLDLNRERLPLIKDEYNCDTRNEYLKDGDIVIADASEDLIDIGKCVELKNVGNKKVVGGLHTIVARPLKDLIHKGYGAYIFKNKYVAEELRFIATGMSVYGISKGNLLKLKIPVPPVQEQKEIALVMERVYSKLEFHEKKKQTLSALFKTLLHELMTGQRRVHEIEFEALNAEIKEMSTSL